MALSKRQLQTAINRLSKATTEAFNQRELIENHCIEVYGYGPGDIDFDIFIDSCDGGCGAADGMTVEEFEYGMLNDGKPLPEGE